MYTQIKTIREKIQQHLVRSFSPAFLFHFLPHHLSVYTYSDTLISHEKYFIEEIEEKTYPLDKFIVIDDHEIIKEIKSLLKRKTAVISIYEENNKVFLHYEYSSSVKEDDKRIKKTIDKDLFLDNSKSLFELDDYESVIYNIATDVLNNISESCDINILDLLKTSLDECIETKYEYDIVTLLNVKLNKKDVMSILKLYGNTIKELYIDYSDKYETIVFNSPESEIEVFNSIVQKVV